VSGAPIIPASRPARLARTDRARDPNRAADLGPALSWIAAHADDLDRHPRFPAEAFQRLAAAGVLGARGEGRSPFLDELRLVRDVSRADGSVGRILDGHLNAVERLLLAPPGVLAPADRSAIAAGHLLLGVWGADPEAGEGVPAALHEDSDGIRLYGVKTFCSGAGGVQRALVIARDAAGAHRLAYVDLASGVSIDHDWYRAYGLRASESHRVVFSGARVLALLGGDGEMLQEPWFSRDAIRTSATWAGIADGVVAAALSWLRRHGADGQLAGLAAGKMSVAAATIDRWLEYAGQRADEDLSIADVSIEARWAIASACREIIAEAATACGARPLATGGAISRGRRDLDLFLLQHRLEPKLAAHGTAAIGASDGQ
jgi:alkylation response protein AidB-like acyl-CoA dehydrogenase